MSAVATKFLNSKNHRIFKSRNGKMFTNSSAGNKVYQPKAMFRKVRKVQKVATAASVPVALRPVALAEGVVNYSTDQLKSWTNGFYRKYKEMKRALSKGYTQKAHAYMSNLKRLIATINKKIRQTVDGNTKEDLNHIKTKAVRLHNVAVNNF
jgi:hypothetical protein